MNNWSQKFRNLQNQDMKVLEDLRELLSDQTLKIRNKYLEDTFTFFKITLLQEQQDIIDIIQSDVHFEYIFFSKYVETQSNSTSRTYLIACFDYFVIIIPEENIYIFSSFFQNHTNISIFCLTQDIQTILQRSINLIQPNIILHFIKYDRFFIQYEIPSLIEQFSLKIMKNSNKNIDQIKIFWVSITQSMSSFLIRKSYFDSKFDVIRNSEQLFKSNNFGQIQMDKEIFVSLRHFGKGVYLIYHIKERKIYALKHFVNDKLFQRERDNFLNLHHPLVPRYFGTYYNGSYNCIIIEYINGRSLDDINQMNLNIKQKMKIIFELLLIVEYIHFNNYIYRDLKPDNIIITDNNIYLFDFNRMIKSDYKLDKENIVTVDFMQQFIAPEHSEQEYTSKSDIYSLGLIIKFILSNEIYQFSKLNEICNQCISQDPSKRPNIDQIIDLFFNEYYSKMIKFPSNLKLPPNLNIHNEFFFPYWFYIAEFENQNACVRLLSLANVLIGDVSGIQLGNLKDDVKFLEKAAALNCPKALTLLGYKYMYGEGVVYDINKAIYYYSIASKYNVAGAQYNLGIVYFFGDHIKQDIDKAIYYFTLASNNNFLRAHTMLGHIYSSSEFNKFDFKKSMHYLSLAAEQDEPEAQFRLGYFYYSGEYITRDIEKVLYWFNKSANQENIKAQYYLAKIFEDGEFVKKDIDKAIFYYQLAGNQKESISLNRLGLIYFNEEKVKDINKGLNYLLLSANLNNLDAITNLGIFYRDQKDANKSIYYFTKAANQDNIESIFNLGLIFYHNELVPRDMTKAIHYFTYGSKFNDYRCQFSLGYIYASSQLVPVDIDKAIYYYKLASDQNDSSSQNNLANIYVTKKEFDLAIYYFTLASNQGYYMADYNLGVIYSEKSYDIFDIQKAIYHFTIAANHNSIEAIFALAQTYSSPNLNEFDMNKALHFYTIAANSNYTDAQFELGLIYLNGKFVKKNIKKAVFLLMKAADNGNIESCFIVGFFYHKGNFVERDLNKAISYYKKASSFNHQFAKNNLGVIYRNGFDKVVLQNIEIAIIYFNEAIKQKNDELAVFNLAHTYLYLCKDDESILNAIKILLESIKKNYKSLCYLELISLALIKKFGFDLDVIKNELIKLTENSYPLFFKIYGNIRKKKLNSLPVFEKFYNIYEKVDYLYDYDKNSFLVKDLLNHEFYKVQHIPEINTEFYNGLGIDAK